VSTFLVVVAIVFGPSALVGGGLWVACRLRDWRRGGEPRGE
jgi:hypothetical protein